MPPNQGPVNIVGSAAAFVTTLGFNGRISIVISCLILRSLIMIILDHIMRENTNELYKNKIALLANLLM